MADQFARVKSLFFDRKEITSKLDPAVRKALSKFGAFVRTRAKSSLRYGDKSSPPGKPPTVHRSRKFTRQKRKGGAVRQPSSPLRELIFFSYDPAARSVVIGPALGGRQSGVPALMEHGGTATIAVDGKKIVARYQPRPFIRPAFETEMKKVEGNFLNIIK